MITRRHSLALLLASGALGAAAKPARAPAAQAFSWDALKAMALNRASQPWHGPTPPNPAAAAVDYDSVGRIQYRAQRALFGGTHGVQFFPLSRYAATPVDIFVVENGMARPFAFSPDLFQIARGTGAAPRVLPGFSGFRVMNPAGRGDWLAWQGASYFRSAGALDQYGLSARGLAINTGLPRPEEFPSFTRFWLEDKDDALIVYALLDSPSVAGAWRFVNRHGEKAATQEVSCAFALRRDVQRLGIAPLTSMFWYGEGNRAAAVDWRPEIHDSDGLAMLTGRGERIWRPLNNPPRNSFSSFSDQNPRGFGLLQRDRHFDHYQDDGVFYEKRPSLWVEPRGDWGRGAVSLFEIPTEGETFDNIVSFWTPEAPPRAGSSYDLGYELRWIAAEPVNSGVAVVSDCWTGIAGRPGHAAVAGARKLVVDFAGQALDGLTRSSNVEPVVSVTHGRLLGAAAYPVEGTGQRWRLMADVAIDGGGPAELRGYLRRGNGALTETLLYQLF